MADFTECSICFWLKINAWNSSYETYFQAGKNGASWADYIFGILRNGSNSTICFTIGDGSSASNNSYITSARTVGEWCHMSFIYSPGKCKIYLNGILDKEYTTTFIPNFAKVTKITIGHSNGSASYQTNCLMNDFRIYDHALSSFEIKQISQGLILHYPLNNNGFGQENLYGNGGDCTDLSGLNNYGNKFSVVVEDGQICAHVTGALKNTAYLQSKIPFTPKPNEEMTFSAWIKIKNIVRGTTNPMCGFYFSGQTINGSWRGATKLKLTVDGIEYSVAPDAWDKAIKDTKWHKIICSAKFGNYEYTSNLLPNIYLRDCTGDLYIHHIKYQRGTIATPWCPNKTDKISDKIGLNSSIEYDCSGYQKNGEKIGIDYNSDTPKCDVSSVFSASPSVVKIPNQNYAIQGSQSMTISVWAYKEDWSQYSQRIYSCTEGGGFNVQPTSSGDIEWSINVYTNAEKTSHKYASDLYIRIPKTDFSSGWHMFTWVYTTEGTFLYIDGVLEKTMPGTSYGLYFNPTAPLILGGEATVNGYTSPYLNGKLSDFRIYCTALSTEDILALYKKSTYIDNEGNLYGAELREV